MKNSKDRRFLLLYRKLWLQIAGSVLASLVLLTSLVSLVQGHLATFMVQLISFLGRCPRSEALAIYERVFRSRQDLLIWILIVTGFLVLVHLLLGRVTGYFAAVLDAVAQLEDGKMAVIHLPAELQPLERGLNGLRHKMQRQEDESRLAEQKKNDLVMYLAHDLKTPLASTIGYLHLVLDEPDISPAARKKYLRIALDKSLRLENLIQEFLEVSRYSLTTIALNRKRVRLDRLLEQMVFELQPVFARRQLTCRIDTVKDLEMDCDPDKLSRVLENLLCNAVQYSRENTEILVQAAVEDRQVRLVVENSGQTIPEQRLIHIFEPFYRADPGRSTEGSGLGLAIAREIVEKHGGTIEAQSRNGRTRFTVTIPVMPGSAAG